MADAFAHGVPQIIVPGHVFERIYNAESVERVGAGVKLDSFDRGALADACCRVIADSSFSEASLAIRRKLAECGGAMRIVSAIEERVG